MHETFRQDSSFEPVGQRPNCANPALRATDPPTLSLQARPLATVSGRPISRVACEQRASAPLSKERRWETWEAQSPTNTSAVTTSYRNPSVADHHRADDQPSSVESRRYPNQNRTKTKFEHGPSSCPRCAALTVLSSARFDAGTNPIERRDSKRGTVLPKDGIRAPRFALKEESRQWVGS